MGKDPWFKWYPKDWLTDEDVKLMSDTEKAIYVDCLNYGWLNKGLPDSVEDIAVVLSRPLGQLRKAWQRVGKKFTAEARSDGRLGNPKQEALREEKDRISETRRKVGAIARAKATAIASANASAIAPANAKVLQSVCNPTRDRARSSFSSVLVSPSSKRESEGDYDPMLGWRRVEAEYPKEVTDSDCRFWVSYIESQAEEDLFFETLPFHKEVRKSRFFPALKKWLEDGNWKVKPKADEEEEW